MPAPTFVGATVSTQAGGGSQIQQPSGTQVGDMLLLHVQQTTIATVPSGWTAMFNNANLGSASYLLAYKVAMVAGAGTAFTVDQAGMAAYRGLTVATMQWSGSNLAFNNPSWPSIASSGFQILAGNLASAVAVNAFPAGFTIDSQLILASAGNPPSFSWAHRDDAPNPTGVVTASGGVSSLGDYPTITGSSRSGWQMVIG